MPAVGLPSPYHLFLSSIACIKEMGERRGDNFFHLPPVQHKGVGIGDEPDHRRHPVAGGLRPKVIQQAKHPHILREDADFFTGFPQRCVLTAPV